MWVGKDALVQLRIVDLIISSILGHNYVLLIGKVTNNRPPDLSYQSLQSNKWSHTMKFKRMNNIMMIDDVSSIIGAKKQIGAVVTPPVPSVHTPTCDNWLVMFPILYLSWRRYRAWWSTWWRVWGEERRERGGGGGGVEGDCVGVTVSGGHRSSRLTFTGKVLLYCVIKTKYSDIGQHCYNCLCFFSNLYVKRQ